MRSSSKKNPPESAAQNPGTNTSDSPRPDQALTTAKSCGCSAQPSGSGCCRDNASDATSSAQPERRSGTGRPPQGSVVDRRLGIDRRNMPGANTGANSGTGLERRRSAGRRLSDFTKSAEEGELTKEQFLFLMAVDAFKKANDRMYPTWTDVLEVVRLLGYRKTMPSELRIGAAEDWLELPDTAANVRPQRWGERAA